MMDHGNDGNSLTWRVAPATAQEITVYETPTCGCCVGWDRHLYSNGFNVAARSCPM